MTKLPKGVGIISIIKKYVPKLRKSSSGKFYKGICPFHTERTASFIVYPARRQWYCFGEGIGGDAVSFLMRIENLDARTAKKRLRSWGK